MFTLSKQNYKISADLGSNSRLLFRNLSILDTGAGPNFLRINVLPSGRERMIEPTVLPSFNDSNNRPFRMLGQVSVVSRLGASQVKLSSLVFSD